MSTKVEHVGILEEIGCSSGPHRLHRRVEVRDRPSLALMEPCLDLVDEDVTRPAMFDGGPRVPKPLSVVLELVQECDILAPGQLCNDLLHNLLVAGSMAAIEAGCPCTSPTRAMWKLQSWEG
jgi:hypothetical protein